MKKNQNQLNQEKRSQLRGPEHFVHPAPPQHEWTRVPWHGDPEFRYMTFRPYSQSTKPVERKPIVNKLFRRVPEKFKMRSDYEFESKFNKPSPGFPPKDHQGPEFYGSKKVSQEVWDIWGYREKYKKMPLKELIRVLRERGKEMPKQEKWVITSLLEEMREFL